jgi:hypothetical protein
MVLSLALAAGSALGLEARSIRLAAPCSLQLQRLLGFLFSILLIFYADC